VFTVYVRSGTEFLSRAVLHYPLFMQGKTKERWEELCAQAASEQNGEKLLELVRQINELLEEKERRLGLLPSKPDIR
jgi:hypothetical protein